MSKLNLDDAILVVVDYQEKLFPLMHDKEDLADSAAKLIKGCRILGIPIIATQQYTKGLGETIELLKRTMTDPIDDDIPAVEFKHIEKETFSCMGEPTFREALIKSGKEQVILCGIEAHICVQQTAFDLYDYGDDFDYEEEEFEFNAEEAESVVISIDRKNDEDEDDYDGTDFEVFLAADCVSSRKEFDKEIAIKRMSDGGIEIMSVEAILFELTVGAKNPAFKRISRVVK